MFPEREELRPARRVRLRRVKAVQSRKKKSQPPIEYVFMPFMTGSQLYGSPDETSDVDLVLIMTPDKAREVEAAFLRQNPHLTAKPYGDAVHIKSGFMNLIICTQPATYHMWLRATQEAMRIRAEEGPLSKVDAKLLFRKLFREFGADPEDDPTVEDFVGRVAAETQAIFESNLL